MTQIDRIVEAVERTLVRSGIIHLSTSCHFTKQDTTQYGHFSIQSPPFDTGPAPPVVLMFSNDIHELRAYNRLAAAAAAELLVFAQVGFASRRHISLVHT